MINTQSLKTLDPVEHLDTVAGLQIFLNDAFETNDPKYITKAIGIVVRTKEKSELTKKLEFEKNNSTNRYVKMVI